MLTIKTWARGAETIPAIDGRELHKTLNIGRDFPTWINARIQSYGFEDGDDYCSYLVERGTATPAKEYLMSLDMAAALCLVERTTIGRELRRFILESQPVQKYDCSGKNYTDSKPMELLTLDDLASFQPDTLKACPKCHTPHKNSGDLCMSCLNFDQRREEKAALVRQRNCPDVTNNDLVQCLIEREGDTTMTVPGSFGTVVTFRRNKYGHAVAKVENPVHRANILKSMFYQSYEPPKQEAA